MPCLGLIDEASHLLTLRRCIAAFLLILSSMALAQKAPATDPLGRTNPRSAVSGFLEACQSNDFTRAAQYLDLSHFPETLRAEAGPRLARQLEDILNSNSSFSPLRLTQNPQGSMQDPSNPNIERVTTVKARGGNVTLDLERIDSTNAPSVWLFSPSTVAAIPRLAVNPSQSALASKLPRLLVAIEFLGTALWQWLLLIAIALGMIVVFRLVSAFIGSSSRNLAARTHHDGGWLWVRPIIEPLLVFVFVAIFAIAERWVGPSALSRLYIGRFLLLVIVCSFAWGTINLIDLFLRRLNTMLDARQRVVSHSLIYLGRRLARAIVVISAAIVILSNWGYNMTTIIAGLGVGGIAVALAAQQTIANIFGGVSVIGDNPVMVGDFGNFGGLIGTVEDIGMRSTRVRTLSRTLVSVPNGSFAGMNLENYSLRDKMLFNPTIQIKRSSAKDQIRACMKALEQMLSNNKTVELGPTPVRLSSYSAASFGVEIFAYVLTSDINEYYKVESELYFAVDDVITRSGVELA